MPSKYPKYVRALGNKLFYQRDFPKRLWMAPQKTFTFPLKVPSSDTGSSQLNRKIAEATAAFELTSKRLENSDPNAFSAGELDKAAAEFLRRKGLQPGQYVRVPHDAELAKLEEQKGYQMQAYPEDFALMSLPEMEDVIDKNNYKEPLTFDDKVTLHAYRKLIDRSKQTPQTLTQLWEEYAEAKGIDPTTREGKRQQIWWDKFIAVAGETIVSPEAIHHIHDGLDRYVEERRGKGIKGQSIKREIAQPIAALNKANKKYRLGWVISPPDISVEAGASKEVFKRHEQRAFVDYCLSRTSRQEAAIAAAGLFLLQCGGMASEAMRLEPERINLEAQIPYIVIKGKTKTKDRPRIVPIVIGADFLRRHLLDGIRWLNRVSDSSHSYQLQRLAEKATANPLLTAHCLRHTLRANTEANGVELSSVAIIGGWSGKSIKVSEQLMSYGTEGLENSEVLKALRDISMRIHKHLLEDSTGKVVNLGDRRHK